jgi:hypothetical protein
LAGGHLLGHVDELFDGSHLDESMKPLGIGGGDGTENLKSSFFIMLAEIVF